MTPQKRVALAVGLTLLCVALMAVLIAARIRHAHRTGMSGVVFVERSSSGKQPRVFGLGPGQIMFAYPKSGAAEAGLRRGDEIVTIGGIPLTDRARLEQLDQRVVTGDTVVYRIRRDGIERDIPVRFLSPFRSAFTTIYGVVTFFVAACFIAIGLLVFTRKPDDRRVVVFYAMVTAGALSLLSASLVALDNASMRGIYVSQLQAMVPVGLIGMFIILFAPLTLHLSLVFPQDRPVVQRYPGVLRLVYGIPLAALIATTAIMLLGVVAINLKSDRIVDIGVDVVIGAVAVIGLLLLIRLVRRARAQRFMPAVLSMPLQSLLIFFGISFGVVAVSAALRIKIVAGVVAALAVCVPYLVLLSFPVLACIALYRSYRDAGVEQRRQVKWPLWGTLIALAVKVLFGLILQGATLYIMATGGDLSRWMTTSQVLQLVPIVVYLLIPLSFAFAILKYRLMNIDVIIKKTVMYGILSTCIIAVYLILVGGLGTLLVRVADLKNQTVVIASTLVVALLFIPLRNRLQHLVDRNLFRQKYDYPQALRGIAADTLSASDMNAFLNASVEKLQQALQNRAVVIFTERGGEFIATAKVGVADNVLGSARLSESAATSFDRPLDPRRRALAESDAGALKKIDATLVVPVRSHANVNGVIALGTKLSDREFDLEDIEFVSSAADQIALAIDRIRVQHDEADFEQARQMQQALIPADVPHVAGLDVSGIWQPARAVGGDYYDVLKLSDTQLAVCIGDVAGKGVPAALLMSALQAAVRASADEDISPRDLCERVRRVVVPSLGTRFVTFFFCTIDMTRRRIRYCNAGHNPPVIARADGTTERLSTGGPVFSRLFRAIPFQDGETELREGDRLVLFTDGVSEARDTAENEFGEDRLQDFVSTNRKSGARELATAIASEVSSFSGGRADDDFTLVAVAVS
jgi:hypothetical protein